jgi:hypothetical protein
MWKKKFKSFPRKRKKEKGNKNNHALKDKTGHSKPEKKMPQGPQV